MSAKASGKYSFTAVGVLLILGALYFYQDRQDFLQNTIATNGTVIDIKRSTSSVIRSTRTQESYRPVIAFETNNGSRIEFTSPAGSSKPRYSKGEIVEVLYRQSSPQEASINSFFSLWGITVILGVLGAVFVGIGCSMIFRAKRK